MKRGILLTRTLGALALVCASLVCAAQAQAQEVERITVDELKTLLARGSVFVLDVRGSGETKIKGARHIPLDQLESRLDELPARGASEIVTYCAWPSEHTSARAAQILAGKGYTQRVRALLGGWNAWLQSGGETEPIDAPAAAGNGSGNKSNDKPPASAAPPPASTTQTQQIASPNPTIKELDGGAATNTTSNTQPAAVRKTTPAKPKRRTKRRARGA